MFGVIGMKKNLQDDLRDAYALIDDDSYFSSITPPVDNNATKTEITEWIKEIKYSVENYSIEKFLNESLHPVD
jgi:hypothetical protein